MKWNPKAITKTVSAFEKTYKTDTEILTSKNFSDFLEMSAL
jgi:hypothetical protein